MSHWTHISCISLHSLFNRGQSLYEEWDCRQGFQKPCTDLTHAFCRDLLQITSRISMSVTMDTGNLSILSWTVSLPEVSPGTGRFVNLCVFTPWVQQSFHISAIQPDRACKNVVICPHQGSVDVCGLAARRFCCRHQFITLPWNMTQFLASVATPGVPARGSFSLLWLSLLQSLDIK